MAGAWVEFFVAFAVFMAAHRIPTAPQTKVLLQARLGARGFTIAYSLLSTVLLAWLIVAAGRAPVVVLWDQAVWHRWLVNLVMPVALGLAVFGISAPNPLSFGGKKTGFDPDRPGIAGVLRHPLLWALALWSTAHLLANGTLAHVILFGSFAGFSVFGMIAIDRRNQRVMGAQRWAAWAQNTSRWPCEALLRGRWHPQSGPSLWRLGLAVVVWAAVFHLHAPIIGVMPNP
ncbi:NnrU family protein (plasmid) [Pseudorhodobacter turbinis]|uniref:NnrU family protein n=1 Tax=Pseudorhodobacter turbinis TaxID=2500533 RepID=A0A4P8ELH8_9RHOB|nr:NnrU family protein [Pseudorhodobacter turbinis]QCO57665.1 NnrU family protein [Pseudorhodobacter turbinis]